VSIHRDTQRTKRFRLGQRRVHVLGVRRVGAYVAGVEFFCQRRAFFVGQIGDHHLGTRGVQPANGGLTQSPRAADDNRRIPADLHRCFLSCN
jgi:hypothetical protein